MACLAFPVSAQINLGDYDTLEITKPEEAKLRYLVNHPDFTELNIQLLKTIREGNYQSPSSQDQMMGIVGSGPRSNSVTPSLINTIPAGLDWHVDVYAKGTTNNVKIKTPEGIDTEVPKLYMPYWNRWHWGVIRNGKDTVACFGKIFEPSVDSAFKNAYQLCKGLHPPVDPKRKSFDYKRGLTYSNYGIFGDFKGLNWQVIFFERSWMAYIFINDELEAYYQLDHDLPDTKMIYVLSKSYPRVQPLLMVRKGRNQSQQADLIRLAMVSMIVAQQRPELNRPPTLTEKRIKKRQNFTNNVIDNIIRNF